MNGRLGEEQGVSSGSEMEGQSPLVFTSQIRNARRRSVVGIGGVHSRGQDRVRERRDYSDDEELDETDRRAFVDEVNAAFRRPRKRRSMRALDTDSDDLVSPSAGFAGL